MERSERRVRIGEKLGIQPISHGQLHTSQIAVPPSEMGEISPERREVLSKSLTERGSNLLPLIVRRTDQYSEEEEYEVVCGADWYLVAKELDIERLWVWVFDLTDEQAAAAKAEIELLAGFSSPDQKTDSEQQKPVAGQRVQPEATAIDESLLDKKLQPLIALLNQLLAQSSRSVEKTSEDRISSIESKIEGLSSAVEKLAGLVEKLIPAPPTPKPPKLNLREAPRAEIERALKEIGAIPNQRKSACQAIEYWKKQGKKLSWENLEKSIKTGPDKILGFAKGTYQKLQQVGEILD
ncbi:MAG: hypothetical protein KME26_13670 [Oscillatoria princeps RMCB-10]|jgi:ParB-like chromosome segregation protein Spo0J|nr:hypothetical protein [Oscillatoria princeps RMCB-10]